MDKYRVHRLDGRVAKDPASLERFLNSLEGDVVSITPHLTMRAFWVHVIDYVLITERVPVPADVR